MGSSPIASTQTNEQAETGPGLVRLDHRSGEHDDPAITVGMLTATLLDRPSFGFDLPVPTSPDGRYSTVDPSTGGRTDHGTSPASRS